VEHFTDYQGWSCSFYIHSMFDKNCATVVTMSHQTLSLCLYNAKGRGKKIQQCLCVCFIMLIASKVNALADLRNDNSCKCPLQYALSFPTHFNWCLNDYVVLKSHFHRFIYYKHKILEYTLLNYFHWTLKEQHMTHGLIHNSYIFVYISWSNVPVCTCMWSVKSYLNMYLHIHTQYAINKRTYQNIKLAYLSGIVNLRSHFCIGSSF